MREYESLTTHNEIGHRGHRPGSDGELVLDRRWQRRIDKRITTTSDDAEISKIRCLLFTLAIAHTTHSQRVITVTFSDSSVIIFTR